MIPSRCWMIGGLAASLLALVPAAAVAQSVAASRQTPATPPAKRFLFEVSGGPGYTAVDKGKWAGVTVSDWSEAGGSLDARLFFKQVGRVSLGAELGYRYFWWYEFPYSTYWISYDVAAYRLGGVARFPLLSRLSADVGGALYFFDDFVDPGLSAAVVFLIPAGPLTLPLHLRTDLVIDSDAMLMAHGLTLGLGFRF